MFNLIQSITESTKLLIKGIEYSVIAKVIYVTENEPIKWYAKIQLENHYVLVISPFDDYMYFGYVGIPIQCDFPTPNFLIYNGKTFNKEADDYQIVREFVFGDCLNMEGEVKFSDYSCDNEIISIGLITRTNERADVYAEQLSIDDITVVNFEK